MRAVRAADREDARLERSARLARRTRAEKIRGAAITTGRLATGIAGLVSAAVVVSGVTLVPWPSWSVVPPVLSVAPSAAEQVRVCPGPFLAVGTDVARINEIASVGAAELTASDTASRALSSSNPNTARDGAAVALSAGSDSAPIAGAQSQRLAGETLRGLSTASCTGPGDDEWLVAGSTALGHSAVLSLTNPSAVDAQVAVEVYSGTGRMTAEGLSAIPVRAGEQVAVSLAGFAPNEAQLALHITSTGGRVVPTLHLTHITGITPAGSDLVGAGAPLAVEQTIPGIIIDASSATAETGEGADGGATLRLLAPDSDTTVTVRFSSETGSPQPDRSVDLTAGSVTDVPLRDLPPGTYSVTVSATEPIVAGVQSVTAAPTGADFAWFTSAEVLSDTTVVAVPVGATALLHLTNPTASDITAAMSDGSEVTVPASGTLTVLTRSGVFSLTGSVGLFASVSLQAPGELASFAVPAPHPVAGSVQVATR